MQYKVPQNIDKEDKILGPLSFVQFIYVLIGGGLVLIAFTLFDTPLFLITAVPITLLTLGFSLIKVQDQPFSRFFMAVITYLMQPKRRMWQNLSRPDASGLGADWLADVKAEQSRSASTQAQPNVQPVVAVDAAGQSVIASNSLSQPKKVPINVI